MIFSFSLFCELFFPPSITFFFHFCCGEKWQLRTMNYSECHVNVAASFCKILQVSRGGGERCVQHALDTLEKAAYRYEIRVMEAFQPPRNCQHSAYHGQEATQYLPFARAGAAGGGDIRGVQLAATCKNASYF